jgi:proteasome accessory factor A
VILSSYFMSTELLPRICGTEVEYGFMAPGMDESKVPLPEMYSWLPSSLEVHNQFLSNGSRLYLDVGQHPEYATPECRSFREAVVAEIAGERILRHIFDAMVADGALVPSYRLQKRVTDSARTMHGSHESYLTSRKVNLGTKNSRHTLATHFVTRSIFTGAGEYDGSNWLLTQKMGNLATLSNTISHHNGSRPIIDTRDKPLSDGMLWQRLHVTCGDANISPWAMRMKLGTTSLVLRLIEHGVSTINITLQDPLAASKKLAGDTHLKRLFGVRSDITMRAVDIQSELAERAAALHEKIGLPEEEVEIIDKWIEACDDARKDPLLLADRVDWVKKKQICENAARTKNEKRQQRYMEAVALSYDLNGWITGFGFKLRDRGEFRDTPSQAEIERAMQLPPDNTRAHLRGAIIRTANRSRFLHIPFGKLERIGWDYVQFSHQLAIDKRSLADPYTSFHKTYSGFLDNI